MTLIHYSARNIINICYEQVLLIWFVYLKETLDAVRASQGVNRIIFVVI